MIIKLSGDDNQTIRWWRGRSTRTTLKESATGQSFRSFARLTMHCITGDRASLSWCWSMIIIMCGILHALYDQASPMKPCTGAISTRDTRAGQKIWDGFSADQSNGCNGGAHMRSFAVRRICQKRQLYFASRLAASILCGSNLPTRARIQNLLTRARIQNLPTRAEIQSFLVFQGAGNLLWRLLNPPSAANCCLPPLPSRLRSLPSGQGIETPPCHGPARKWTIEHLPPWDPPTLVTTIAQAVTPSRLTSHPSDQKWSVDTCAVIGEWTVNWCSLSVASVKTLSTKSFCLVSYPIHCLARFAGRRKHSQGKRHNSQVGQIHVQFNFTHLKVPQNHLLIWEASSRPRDIFLFSPVFWAEPFWPRDTAISNSLCEPLNFSCPLGGSVPPNIWSPSKPPPWDSKDAHKPPINLWVVLLSHLYIPSSILVIWSVYLINLWNMISFAWEWKGRM